MSRLRRLAPGLLVLLLAAGGCGKYGPPQRIMPAPAPAPGAAPAESPAPEKDADQEARP